MTNDMQQQLLSEYAMALREAKLARASNDPTTPIKEDLAQQAWKKYRDILVNPPAPAAIQPVEPTETPKIEEKQQLIEEKSKKAKKPRKKKENI